MEPRRMVVLGKSRQVAQRLRNRIERGRWKPGDAVPSERELSQEYGVSRVAIRDALLALANEGLLVRRQGSGTFVADRVGQRDVALLCTLNDLTAASRFYARALIDELQRLIEGAGHKSVLGVGHGSSDAEIVASIHALQPFVAQNIAGVVSVTRMAPAVHERLTSLGIPAVTVDAMAPTSEHAVLVDYAAMLKLGARVLRAAGHADFAVMAIDWSAVKDETAVRVFSSITHACQAIVKNRPERYIGVPEGRPELAYGAFRQWWQGPGRPKALLFADDVLCDIAWQAMLDLGVRVPGDLAFISEASTATRFRSATPVSRLEFSVPDLAAGAWDMLNALMDGRTPEPKVRYIAPVYRAGETLG